jgi:pSer/pThr/pTyr-binding forkhead associated (FHA) protein
MPKLIVKFDDRELKECAVGTQTVTIGRLPDNTLVIDNPAVSGRHARVYRDGAHYVLEDLKSTNGTFVNDKPIARHALVAGDVILIGKHLVVFDPGDEASSQSTAAAAATRERAPQKHLLTGLEQGRPSQVYDAVVPKTAIPTAQGRIGSLKVTRGDTDQSAYLLSAVTTMIGKSEAAQIKLKGWFKPKIAAAIARRGEGFTITPMGGTVSINGEKISGRRDLMSGDLIEVSGLSLEFTLS